MKAVGKDVKSRFKAKKVSTLSSQLDSSVSQVGTCHAVNDHQRGTSLPTVEASGQSSQLSLLASDDGDLVDNFEKSLLNFDVFSLGL